MNRTAKTLAATATGAVALGLGLGVAGLASADPSASPAPSASPSASASAPATPPAGGPGDHRGRPGRGDRGQLAEQLAAKLGVDQALVETALREYRDANRPSTKPDPGTAKPDPAVDDAALAKALADKLDVTEAKVTAALQEIRAAHDADRAAAVKTRLDEAVKAGTLTTTEADAVQKAADAGIVHVGPR